MRQKWNLSELFLVSNQRALNECDVKNEMLTERVKIMKDTTKPACVERKYEPTGGQP